MSEPTEAEKDLICAICNSYTDDKPLVFRIELIRSHVAAEFARAQKEDRETIRQLSRGIKMAFIALKFTDHPKQAIEQARKELTGLPTVTLSESASAASPKEGKP